MLITLVVDGVFAWYNWLAERGVELLTGVKEVEKIQVRVFFMKDPGGYTLEIQQFLNPGIAEVSKVQARQVVPWWRPGDILRMGILEGVHFQ